MRVLSASRDQPETPLQVPLCGTCKSLPSAAVIVSVTALGARDGDAAGAVSRVVDYLDGRCPAAAGRSPGWWDDKGLSPSSIDDSPPMPEASDGALAYYADSVEGPGVWLGRGLSSDTLAGD